MEEELGIKEDDIEGLKLKYITLRFTKGEIRQNYYFFADLKENVNNIIGHKKENILKLKEYYDVDVRVEANDDIKPGKFKLEIEKTYQDFLNNK